MSPRPTSDGDTALPSWWEALLAALEDASRALFLANAPHIAHALSALHERGAAAWPELALEPARFVNPIARHLGALSDLEGFDRWCALAHPEDLYLATCCIARTPGAIAAFDRHFRRDIDTIARRFDGQRYGAEDLVQILMEKLFVGPAPKIEEYSGQGFLLNWLRVMMTRTLIDVVRGGAQQKRESLVDGETLASVIEADLGEDLEVQFLKREYRAEFKRAFGEAMRDIEPAQRAILRQHLVERLSIDQLGAIYGMHRATAARHLERAREALLQHTRQHLMARLRIDLDEFDAIMTLIHSRLEVSMTRLLTESIARAERG